MKAKPDSRGSSPRMTRRGKGTGLATTPPVIARPTGPAKGRPEDRLRPGDPGTGRTVRYPAGSLKFLSTYSTSVCRHRSMVTAPVSIVSSGDSGAS